MPIPSRIRLHNLRREIRNLEKENQELKDRIKYCNCGKRALNNMMGYSNQDPQRMQGHEI